MSQRTPPSYNHGDRKTIELSPLLKSDASSFEIDLEAQYTPVLIDGKPVEVTFAFTPHWPIEGVEREDVIGRLGKTQRATATIVRRAFAAFADYPIDRIEFLAPIPYDGRAPVGGIGWAVVMEEAWDRFLLTPTRTLVVRLKDGPTDVATRLRHAQLKELRELGEKGLILVCFAVLVCGIVGGSLVAIWSIYHWLFY